MKIEYFWHQIPCIIAAGMMISERPKTNQKQSSRDMQHK